MLEDTFDEEIDSLSRYDEPLPEFSTETIDGVGEYDIDYGQT